MEERMDGFVRDQMSAEGVPGVAYAVVDADGARHAGTFGHDGDGDPINASTTFLWGSVAKPVTATLVMELVEADVLQLDASITAYLPSFGPGSVDTAGDITIRHLLDHTSGIPAEYELTDRFASDRRPVDVVRHLADAEPISSPGVEFHYASVNYLVLAAVIEEVTGRSFTDVLTDRVLEPVGMTEAITTPGQAGTRLPPGHRWVFGRPVSFDTPYDPAGASYGYLGGSLEDAAAFASANLGASDDVLSPTQRDAMFPADEPDGDDTSYGLGWRRWLVPGTDHDMIWHGGAVAGYQAAMVLLPERDRAIVVLKNAYGVFQDRPLLDTAFGLAALVHEEEPRTTDVGIDYPAALGVLLALAGMVAGLAVRAGWLLFHPRRVGSRTRAAVGLTTWLIATCGLLYGVVVLLPATFGIGFSQIILWAPDVAWLADATVIAALVLLALRAALGVRSLRRPPGT